MGFINQSERAAMGVGFAKTEAIESTSGETKTVVVYCGYAPWEDAADSDSGWMIQKSTVVINGDTTNVTEQWAKGSWTNRASLNYKYK